MNSSRCITEFSNIRVTNDGFQVVFVRAKIEIRKALDQKIGGIFDKG